MTVDYLIVCDNVHETYDGRFVIVGVLDQLAHSVFPVRLARLAAFACLRGAPDVIEDVELVWVSPEANEIWRRTRRLSVGPRGFNYWRVEITDVAFPRAGRYRLVIRGARRELASTELDVRALPQFPERVQ